MSRALAISDPPLLASLRAAPALGFTRTLEVALSLIMLFLFSQGLIGPLFADESNPEGSAVLRLMWLPVYGVTLILMLARPGAILRTLVGNWLILVLIGLTFASVLWSIEPDTTLRRSFALLMTTLAGLWLASRWSWRELILLIAATFVILGGLSTFMALAVPSLGVDHAVHAGAWKGIWWEKNTLGARMALGAVSCYAAANIDPKRVWFWLGCAVFCTALVLLSTSKTALLAWSLGTAGAIGIAFCRKGFGFAALMLFMLVTGGVTIALVLLIAPLEALEALGRDATLTGRTDIWVVLIEQVRAAPWTGYGYKAYWTAEFGPVFWVRQATDWDVPTAHNAWIEIALSIGLPGVLMMAVIYLRALGRGLARLFTGPETYWALGLLAIMGLVSISESNLMQQNSLTWVLFVATAAKLRQRDA